MSPSHRLSPSQHASALATYYVFLFVLLLAAYMNIIPRQASYLTFYRTPGSDLTFIRFKYHCAGFNFSFQSTEIFGILILSFGMTLPRPATTPSALQGGGGGVVAGKPFPLLVLLVLPTKLGESRYGLGSLLYVPSLAYLSVPKGGDTEKATDLGAGQPTV